MTAREAGRIARRFGVLLFDAAPDTPVAVQLGARVYVAHHRGDDEATLRTRCRRARGLAARHRAELRAR